MRSSSLLELAQIAQDELEPLPVAAQVRRGVVVQCATSTQHV
jgi:hypothetical protein